ncbi:MAG: aldehyde dehydrogenase family protein [Flavobacteriaceae bacterium]|nr:aldehyde dehydrogenase family protein [Flavobacteriaceae bacterium]|tara:strand:+ start:9102 stop:10646 length:1545 start_codon:yes stop_codon:yes gene_type:complete
MKQEINLVSVLKSLNIKQNNAGTSTGSKWMASKNNIVSFSPVDGKKIGSVTTTTGKEFESVMTSATSAFKEWRLIPAPKRGEIVRQFGDQLRTLKDSLGKLVSYEMGKSLQEGLGEVQEMIDICDFAVGLSRQLHGFTMHSERPGHRMYEQYHPLGVVGIISAFNFPVAVWAWNTALAWVCGDVCVWKPSEKTPLCGIACQKIIANVLAKNNLPEGISCLINGDYSVGELITNDSRARLISATGSTKMGKIVAKTVGERLGKCLLELGGNNAIIVTPEADIKMTVIGAVFGAVGTAGQRCTSTRRLIVHESIYDDLKSALISAYDQIQVGNPLDEKNHVGPLIDEDAVKSYLKALIDVEKEGGNIIVPGEVLSGDEYLSGCYVKPAIAEAKNNYKVVQRETFAPVLYLLKYSGSIENAIMLQNDVKQGLSSAIMTGSLRDAELFLSHSGSDCGIANVNIGTSGAEIGGAFGGEKDTGGGRESGSDAWKIYMRRQTNTINYTKKLPLAQGIEFKL